VHGQIDLVTGTLGKALGGAMGGYTTGRADVIAMLRQRSRPYLFSNSLAPAIVGASLEVFRMLEHSNDLALKLAENVRFFKEGIRALGFDFKDGASAIVPIMLYDASLSQRMADALLDEGVYVIGFFFPVVPQGKARIRVQLSAAHTRAHLEHMLDAFGKVGKQLGVIQA
jgi:glycine C-acetyltransferase